jgi:ABC-3C protein
MIRSKARDYLDTTKKRLFSLAYNTCSFPGCDVEFARDDREELLANICHIEAAEPGGERYNPNSNDEYRRSYENLILLCANHHIVTNDVEKYTVEVLKEMKRNHQEKMRQRYSSEGVLNKYPSALGEVINRISSESMFDGVGQTDFLESFHIEDKINYNNVRQYKSTIDEYKIYQGRLNTIYVEIEKGGSYKKELLLENIKSLYLKAKGKILNGKGSIQAIQEKADDLIRDVEKSLWDILENRSNNLSNTIPYEAINLSLHAIMVDAFMRCKILEEPPKQ